MALIFPLSSSMQRASLERALCAALAGHRPAALRAQLAAHGPRRFTRALAMQSTRAIADALSMLEPADRAEVTRLLAGRLMPEPSRWWLRTRRPLWRV